MTPFRTLQQKFARIWPHLHERARRMMAANEALQLGYGGVSVVSRVCGLSRVTITKGLRELRTRALPAGRLRHPGGGRPTLLSLDPELPRTLEALVEPLARGDPESPLRWTSKSTRVNIHGLWTYDLRRTLACYLSNELRYDDHTVRAILNHYDGTALGRYSFKSFDSLTVPIQHYADWLWALKGENHERHRHPILEPTTRSLCHGGARGVDYQGG